MSAVRAEAERLLAAFQDAGALPVEAPVLLPAEVLLDLYGEEIRARAFTTHDPLRGELMLRPDFTVPVVQMHMESGAEPARYAYAGEVFRVQDVHPSVRGNICRSVSSCSPATIRPAPMPRFLRCSTSCWKGFRCVWRPAISAS